MKKKLILFILGACLLTTAAAAAVFGSINQPDPESVQEEISIYTTYDKAPKFQVRLSDRAENAVFEKLDRSGEEKDAIYSDIMAYKKLKKLYRPSQEEMDYLDDLIESGADVSAIAEIYRFWLSTSEDISIIGQIYSMSNLEKEGYWVEELFNQITENRHGILDETGVNSYYSKGLAASDINIANVLSRKGVMTIHEVLDRRAAGDDWNSLIELIGIQREQPEHRKYMGEIKTDSEFMNYLNFVYTVPAEAIAQYVEMLSVESEESITSEDIIFLNENRVRKEVNTELLADGVFVRDEREESQESNKAVKERIRENGVADEQTEAFLDEGYTLLEILNASEVQKSEAVPAAEILQEQRLEQFEDPEAMSE